MTKLRTAVKRLGDWWLDHLWVDLAGAGLVLAAHLALVVFTGKFDVLGWASGSDRRAVYSAAAVVVSVIGTLSGIAVGQLGSSKGDRTSALKRDAGRKLAASWRSIFRGAMLAALLALTALALEPSVGRDTGSNVARWIFEFGLSLAVLKFFRLSALFHAVIMVSTLDAVEGEDGPKGQLPRLNDRWASRAS